MGNLWVYTKKAVFAYQLIWTEVDGAIECRPPMYIIPMSMYANQTEREPAGMIPNS